MDKRLLFVSAILTVVLSMVISVSANVKVSDDNVWKEIDDSALKNRPAERLVEPNIYRTFQLNKSALQTILENAPMEDLSSNRTSQTILILPLPDGTFSRFRIQESPIMEEGLAVRYPNLKTYIAQGVDVPSATARISYTPTGFRAMILSGKGSIMIDPYALGDSDNYISYAKSDVNRENLFVCEFDNQLNFVGDSYKDMLDFGQTGESVISGSTLRTYRLALAATGEYTNVFRQGGDSDAQAKARALEQQVIVMTRVNGVYERELTMRMVLIANNDTIIYTDPATDPYTNSSGSQMLGQNTTNLNNVIMTANYDIGHVFSTGGGGVATLNGPCGSNKARGVTGLPNPVGDPFSIDYVAHEMGHQWGGNHTFNGCGTGQRSATAAFEPGSAITIMGYAGICGGQDLARNSIDTFHVRSLEEIVTFSQTGNGNTCAVSTATANTPPAVTSVGGTSFNIPKQTPFALTANGTDAENDSITYDWQQYDLGPNATTIPNTDSDGNARPIFRPYLPTESPTRYFPSLQYILNNANVPPSTFDCGRATPCMTGELLPAITRTMNFQVVARDNRLNGGGINTVTVQVMVDGNSGPFAVTAPNTGVIYNGNSQQTVTWNNANTTSAPVNATHVKISLSTDGGQTFPTTLAASTPNNGSATVTIPNVQTSTARIKVEAAGNIFFDISDANFTINQVVAPSNEPPFDFDGDNKTDIGIFRPSVGQWWYQKSSDNGVTALQFGNTTDRPVPADYTGDNKADVAFWRPSTGEWFILRSEDFSFFAFPFGSNGDIPAPGDYDGDNKTDAAVFRPSTNTWFIQRSSGGVTIQGFGSTGDQPVVADYDGDSKSDIAIFRPSVSEWWILRSTAGLFAVQFGSTGDKPVQGDYTGDGKADVAFWRPSNGNWTILRSEDLSFFAFPFGSNGDTPAPGDYDGDGKFDAAVYRPTNSTWFIQRTTAGTLIQGFGQAGDVPLPSVYIP